ncbi:hypothetical protein KC360_g1964 [Hortaea werneckii]|nr:hypothetical protein KC325_g2544 [Hortaea werneckii]KAI6997069.1 hypothetical protein KC359_g3194 [Hortaea werneckii]KAI7148094.1 hypothetical protein KC344_g2197 [Hortaea werneckii]KAI7177988.1 hypothetical protein KC360_g1964 [Hortaea werneckii]
MFQTPTTTMTTATQTQAPLFAGLKVTYPSTLTTTSKPIEGTAGNEECKGEFPILFGPAITVRDPTPSDPAPAVDAQDGIAVASSAPPLSPSSSSLKMPDPRSCVSARQKGAAGAPSGLKLRKRNAAGFKVALGRLRVRFALRGEDVGVREGSGGAEGEVGREMDFNRFERRRDPVLQGGVALEMEMWEGFEGSGEDVGEGDAGYEGQGEGEVEGGVEVVDEDLGQDEDQGQVEDDYEDEVGAEVEEYGDEDEESGPGQASFEDLLLSTDLLSLRDSKAMYAQWEDRKPSRPTPGTDDIKAQEEIDTAFVEAIHASNAIKWGNSASIRDISPSSNVASTNKTSHKRPSARATQQIPFKLHVPSDHGKNPYYTPHGTLEDAAKHILLTLTEANASCNQWISLRSREDFESLVQQDSKIQARLNAICQELGSMAQLVEYGREGWELAELSKMVLGEVCEVGGELFERLRVLAGYEGCEMLEKVAVAPLVRVWKGLSE